MTDMQLYLTIGIPVITNAALSGLLMMFINARIDGLSTKFDVKFDGMNSKFDSLRNEMNARFDGAHQALLRVEGVLDARLRHLEETER